MLKAIEEQMKREKFEVMNFDDYCALGNTVSRLRSELAALKAELREICAAIDDPACDLTLTAVECIKKLKGRTRNCERMLNGIRLRLRRRMGAISLAQNFGTISGGTKRFGGHIVGNLAVEIF